MSPEPSIEQSKTRIIEERTQQAEEGKSRVTEARIQIQKEIANRAQAGRLPKTMTALLHQVWSKIPLLAHLKEGPNSKNWRQTIATLSYNDTHSNEKQATTATNSRNLTLNAS